MDGLGGFTSCLSGAKEMGVICGAGAWKMGEIKGKPAMKKAYDGAFITGSDFHRDGGVTAACRYGIFAQK